MRSALLVGATGLIGHQVLDLLLKDDSYSIVYALSRKALSIQHPKLRNIVVDFNNLSDHYRNIQANDIFCCLGTTMKTAGSKEAFKKVDYEYPLEVAKQGKINGAEQYLLVSALGANKQSSIYYNRVKGEIETSVREVGYPTLHIFRPSLLLGNREESRQGESIAKIIYKLFGLIIPTKYKAIDSIKVARAMLHAAKQPMQGFFIHESDKLQHF